MHIILSTFSKLRRTFHDDDHYLLPKRQSKRIRETTTPTRSKRNKKGRTNSTKVKLPKKSIIINLMFDTKIQIIKHIIKSHVI